MQSLGKVDYFAVLTVSELFSFKDVYAILAHLRALGSEKHKDDLPNCMLSLPPVCRRFLQNSLKWLCQAPCSVSVVSSSFPGVSHFASSQDSFQQPLHSAWEPVSYCSGLQYQESFSYGHMMLRFQAALLSAWDLWSLFRKQCTLQSDIPESENKAPSILSPLKLSEFYISLYLF